MNRLINIIFSIIFSFMIIIGVINFTVGFKQLYYFDIDYLNIPSSSGLSREEIVINYDYLIDYNLSKEVEEFEMPTIKSSKEGKIHFEEVRDIFQNLKTLFKICFVISIIGLYINIKNKNIDILKYTSIGLISIPVVFSLPIILNFEKSFIAFHEIMFSNDYWIFDPSLDPVINILPEEFFYHAGLMILGGIFIASIVLYISYKYFNKRKSLM